MEFQFRLEKNSALLEKVKGQEDHFCIGKGGAAAWTDAKAVGGFEV